MLPISFKEETGFLSPPDGVDLEQCNVLPICHCLVNGADQEVFISCWKLTKEELEEINKTGRVYLMVWGNEHPIVSIAGITPFQ